MNRVCVYPYRIHQATCGSRSSPYAFISILVARLQHALSNAAVRRVTHCTRQKGGRQVSAALRQRRNISFERLIFPPREK